MSDDQVQSDGEDRSLLAELWETPVGRRSVLKAGLASAAALGVGSAGAPAADAARRKKRSRVETTDLHFALGHVRGVSRLTLHANGKRHPLKRHTKASREALRRRGGIWRAADLSQLTHHVTGVKLPGDRGLIVSVRGKRGRRDVLVAQLSRAPWAAVIAHARRSRHATGSFKHAVGPSRRLARHGLKATDFRSAHHVAQFATVVDEWTTAVGLTSWHPNIANVTLTAETNSALLAAPAIKALSAKIVRMQNAKIDTADFPPVKNQDGTTAMITIPGAQKPTSFTSFRLNPQGDRTFPQLFKAGLIGGIHAVRNDPLLGAVIDQPLQQDKAASTQTWVQPQGLLPQAQPSTSAPKAGIDIQVKNPGFWYGTQTVVTGGYNNGQVGLTLYNNFVRWVWVYVQYLGAGNENMSANPNATFPDTKYSKSLAPGLLPQVFTVLGVPVWDANSIDVTLSYPAGAHTARLLFCGLGSTLLDGNWRNYFPADAYPDQIGPTDEVVVPSLLTVILSIGVTAFALATDIDVAATYGATEKIVEEEIAEEEASDEDFRHLLVVLENEIANNLRAPAPPRSPRDLATSRARRKSSSTPSGSLAVSVATGSATYQDISSGGATTDNVFDLLLSFAVLIPKLLFAAAPDPFIAKLAGAIVGVEAADKVVDAIPFIGQVLAVVDAVGDAVTLAESLAETIVSPWVIENEVTLTYQATITINRSANPPDSTFPATARAWSLTASVDGAVVFDPVTGTVNPGGRLQSTLDPVTVTAPFGGDTIQWSVVFTTPDGVQVGTGSSAQFVNNDPNNPTTEVSITITEIPPEIDASTVFNRAVTTGYSSSAGGYTWTDQLSDKGTVESNGIQQVTGTTISTLAGVAGMVWEQNNQFYIRGVPIAQNGSTISLGKATNEGYARRPFLLFDPFVDRSSQGNHVLLEPDPKTTAYHVRKVMLDPTTGAPTWDPTTSYGDFLLPISAAALHSSGRVVVVDTGTGRLGSLLPAAPPAAAEQAVLASYTAGPGTQIGLLNSPIAIAVTEPGTVLVLEAATSQLAAFDLNGNPIPYFATSVTRRALLARRKGAGPVRRGSGQGQYTMPLVSNGTYLDLGVDGAGQIYLLYYTGDGSAVADYHIDVYSAAGAPIATHSAGANVPHFAVDYFRSLFAANYDKLVDIATNQPHIDPALGVAEPSMSRFDPTESTTLRQTHKHKHKHKPKHRRKHKPKPKHK